MASAREPRGRHVVLGLVLTVALGATAFLVVELAGWGRAGPEPRARDAVAILVDGLRSRDPDRRAAAAQALGQLSQDASRAVPALNEALRDPSRRVQAWANYALARIDRMDPAALASLRRLSEDPDPGVRQAAQDALQRLGQAKP